MPQRVLNQTGMLRQMLIGLAMMAISLQSAAQKSDVVWAYINKYKDIALEQEIKYGMPASITLAQGILESGAGRSGLTKRSNNHFGIKKGSKWKGKITKAWDDDPYMSSFRVYNSAAESYEDHTRFLKYENAGRYGWMFNKLSVFDYRSWARGLKSSGYATAPNYAEALIGYIDRYRLYEINGGRKLRGGKATTITKTITREVLIKRTDLILEDSVETEEEKEVEFVTQKYYVEINGVDCTVLYPGESLSNIARNYNISKQKLLEYNEIANENDVQEGDIVFLAKKKNKFKGSQDYYRVKEGDTLYQIAQQFGVTVAYLSKINDLNLFDQLRVGKKLRLK